MDGCVVGFYFKYWLGLTNDRSAHFPQGEDSLSDRGGHARLATVSSGYGRAYRRCIL